MSRDRSKEIKRHSVIAAARRARVLSRAELTELTGLSPATLTPLVRDLIAEGYLIERGRRASRSGRPRTLLEFNAGAELVAAVSLEPSRINCEIADSDGKVVAHGKARLRGDVVATVCRFVPELVGDALPLLRGVAIAVPGVYSGGAVRLAPFVGLHDGEPLGASVQAALGVPVVVDNDVNLMAAGEHAAGAGRDVTNLVLLHVADGIGAGLVIDGKVRRGASGAAGEVGFMPLEPGAKGRDGIGPLEARWSASAIADRVVALRPGRRPASPVRPLIEMSKTDRAAAAYLNEVLRAWARLITSIVCVIDPGRVVLSGAAADLDDAALQTLESLVSQAAPTAVEVRRAVLGDGAVLHGAVSYALTAAAASATAITGI